MPFTGGDADKVGNRYEALWTVYCLLRILHEEADSIHIEQIGEQWNGIEFSLDLQNQTEYHQVKRQNGSKGHWPIAHLIIHIFFTIYINYLDLNMKGYLVTTAGLSDSFSMKVDCFYAKSGLLRTAFS